MGNAGSHREYRLAVVESDDDQRELMAEIFHDRGHNVITAEAADALPPSWRGDAILTDTFAAVYDAAAASDLVRRYRERFDCAVVVVSGHSEIVREAGLLGADAFITKPFDLDDLLSTVEAVIEQRTGRRRE